MPWLFEIPEKREDSKNSNFSYIYTLYRLHTFINLYYNMSYSEGDDSDGTWKVSQLTMMKERSRMRRALTIARTETPSQREMQTLSLNRGLLLSDSSPCSCGDMAESAAPSCTLSTRGATVPAQHNVFIFAVFIKEHQLICCIVMVVFNIYSVR